MSEDKENLLIEQLSPIFLVLPHLNKIVIKSFYILLTINFKGETSKLSSYFTNYDVHAFY